MDLRQEQQHIFDAYRWYEENLGVGVIWHEFDSEASQYHNTYDEGGRHYTAGIYVMVLWAIITEARADRTEQGRKPTERLTLAISARSLDQSGVSEPEDFARHLNDVIRYEDRLWKITDYNIRGQIPDSVILGVSATQIYSDEELTFDEPPGEMNLGGERRDLPYPNAVDTPPTFVTSPPYYVEFYD